MNNVTPINSPNDPELEQLLRSTFAEEAESVSPSADLQAIRTRAGRQGGRPRTLFRGLVAATTVAVVGAAVTIGVVVNRPAPVNEAVPMATSSDAGTPAGQPSATVEQTDPMPPRSTPGNPSDDPGSDQAALPVFWLDADNKLHREYHLRGNSGGDRVKAAIQLMISADPYDPDYVKGPWRPSDQVEVTRTGDALVVDLPSGAFADTAVTPATAQAALQQLVHTATAAIQVPGPVTILIDGKPGRAWGVVDVGEPMTRDVDARAQVWIDNPQHGETKAPGEVTVSGSATAFEGNLNWEVVDADGEVIADGYTTAGANGTYGSFSFTVDLEPGTYVVRVWEPSAKDGSRLHLDDHEFTVE